MPPDNEEPPLPPPGWYRDPYGMAAQRYWDGSKWKEQTAGPKPSNWQGWPTTSVASLWVDRGLAAAAGLGALVAAVVVLATGLGGRPLPGIGLLLIPGIPLLFGGQLWMILVMQARMPRVSGGWRAKMSAQMKVQRNPRTFFFPGLPKQAAYGLLGVLFLAWLAAMTAAIPASSQGSPTSGMPGCPWPLEDHGTITCVSHAAYLQAGAAVERFAAGVIMGFFVIHFGVVTSEIARRRGSVS